MSTFYEFHTGITARDVDGQQHWKPSAVLCALQDAATEAAEVKGFSREVTMERYGAFWMLARVWYRQDRPLLWGEELMVRTWHRGGKGAAMYRDYDLYVGDELVGEGTSVWVLARLSDRKLLRLSDIEILKGTDGGELCKTIQLNHLRIPDGLTVVEHRRMHYSDTDINGHVNNTRYADFACDAIRADRLPQGSFVSSLQIGFTGECRPGEELTLLAGGEGEQRYVQGVDETGKSHFDAALILGTDMD